MFSLGCVLRLIFFKGLFVYKVLKKGGGRERERWERGGVKRAVLCMGFEGGDLR